MQIAASIPSRGINQTIRRGEKEERERKCAIVERASEGNKYNRRVSAMVDVLVLTDALAWSFGGVKVQERGRGRKTQLVCVRIVGMRYRYRII